ncbi:uncharacterized protein SAPINGB_P005806 [Magnusiomyces paraingens]|uniref:Uncharacterized protein n=1 Tax=Magnusiomyces paraingens TaxID=2606893 RepID=A0A5E8C3R0_9ASCO|nr:uncharacterized protein SAPINGB_P005806 [Saprochaete ingens]VVT57660.1 unnamed protein product [Saprochaete ingens]
MAVTSFEQSTRSSASSTKESKRHIFGSILRHLAPQVQVEGNSKAISANHASKLWFIFLTVNDFTMATNSFEQISRSTSSSSSTKGSKRHIFSSILRHLAPQVQVEGNSRATSSNHASVLLSRAH